MAAAPSRKGFRGAAWALPPLLAAAGASSLTAQTDFQFDPPFALSLGFQAYPNSIDAGDLDGNGFADLVVAARNNDGRAALFFGEAGGFGLPVDLEVGDQTNWALLRDLDGDELLDVAISHRQGVGRVSLLRGDGAGGLAPPDDFTVGRDPNLIRAADLDGDGDPDLAVTNWGTGDVTILANAGGAFTQRDSVTLNRASAGTPFAPWLVAADLDGDEDVDLAAVALGVGTGRITYLFNRGDGTFEPSRHVVVPEVEPGEALGTLAAADLDGDGDVDLVTKTGDTTFVDRLILLANDGTGRFQTAAVIPLAADEGGSPWDLIAADLDGDEHLDLVWVTHFLSTRVLGLLRNAGTGDFQFELPEQTFFLDGFPRAVKAVDLEGDGDLDVVASNIGSHQVAVLVNQMPLGAAGGGAPLLQRRGAGSIPLRPAPQRGADGAAVLGALARFGPSSGAGGGAIAGDFPACGDPKAGDCFEPNDTPGCADAKCCNIVCDEDPFCCEAPWDENCAELAAGLCEEPPICPAKGSCFLPRAEVGCEDTACCELVCLVDGYCCGAAWDHICAEEASLLCGLKACTLPDCPPDAIAEDEGIDCFERANDGCNLQEPLFTPLSCGQTVCGTAWTFFVRDTDWYEVVVDEPTTLTWTVRSEFPAEVLAISGTCADEFSVRATAWASACRPASATILAEPGTHYLVVAAGTEARGIQHGIGCLDDKGKLVEGGAFTNRYQATVTCSAPCGADLDGDEAVGIGDLLAMLAAWGTPGGPADLDASGVVDLLDLQILLGSWGPCF